MHASPASSFSPASSQESLPIPAISIADALVRSRLGPYAALYYALRAKHPPTAAHCIRVALACSKWGIFCGLSNSLQDELEIAALMHDVGKIGISDTVLQKPQGLSPQELASMSMSMEIGIEMLAAAGATNGLVQTIAAARLPFESNPKCSQTASMLKIVDAFDAMTNDQVFRPAFSREHALEELCLKAGTQFDPALVRSFAELIQNPRPELEDSVAKRWLSDFAQDANSHFSGQISTGSRAMDNLVDSLFHRQLLESLNDGAIYLDAHGKILSWNRAMEAISGKTAASVLHCSWSPKIIGLLNEDETPVTHETCPLVRSLKVCSKHSANMRMSHSSGKSLQIAMSSIPLFTSAQSLAGFVVLIHDDSRENDLVRTVETLHAIATQDPLTKVANRAELDRRLEELVVNYNSTGVPSAVIMCDIDFFKRINDTYSHQAGDEALITFAALLREFARKDDLVARYGGEEFVVLCQGCDISAATARAEELRKKIERTPVPAIGGKSMTSSFGVTEYQPGDDADTVIARADRALMTAKQTGRNRVVQMGAGSAWNSSGAAATKAEVEAKRSSWLNWFTGSSEPIESREFLSAVPIEVAIQKLEGFVSDHKAELLSNSDNEISIRVIGGQGRRGEHRIAMMMNVKVLNVQFCTAGRSKVYQNRTKFSVSIHPVKSRDRRQSVVEGQAHQLILSFQAYIVGQEIDESLKDLIILPR